MVLSTNFSVPFSQNINDEGKKNVLYRFLLAETVSEFYAQKLFPFTRYRLKVFILNSDNSYNIEVIKKDLAEFNKILY
jgi:hypothetical protein